MKTDILIGLIHARIQKVMSEGVQKSLRFLFVFLVDKGIEDPNTTI